MAGGRSEAAVLLAALLLLPLLLLQLLLLLQAPGVAAQRTPAPAANTTTLRIAVLPGVFTSQNATDLEQYMLRTFNESVKVVFEEQPTDETAYLQLMLQVYLPSRDYDAYMVNMQWTDQLGAQLVNLAPNVTDLCPYTSATPYCDFIPYLLSPYEYGAVGAYVAAPLYANAAVLYYRTDLTTKYAANITQPPYATYGDLIQAATTIMNGERAGSTDASSNLLSGYLFQGAINNELTALTIELINANGGGTLIDAQGRVTVNNPLALQALFNMTRWVGTVAPSSVVFKADDSIAAAFEACQAPFMRNVPDYLPTISMRCAGFPTLNLTGLPVASALSGWGMAVPTRTVTTTLAIQAVEYLTSTAQQAAFGRRLSVMPTRRSSLLNMCLDPVTNTSTNSFYACYIVTGDLGATGRLMPPIAPARGQYNAVSVFFSTWVNRQLAQRPTWETLQASLAQVATDLTSILYSANAGEFCGFANGVEITCASGLTCVNSVCFNFVPLILGTPA
jgi:trehalose/maltose transport system substrate-binding protein